MVWEGINVVTSSKPYLEAYAGVFAAPDNTSHART